MFKQFRDGWNSPKVAKAINTANILLNHDQPDQAWILVERAAEITFRTTFSRTPIINLITAWGLLAIRFDQLGQHDRGQHCSKISDLLQARFNAGEYYREQ